MSAPERTFELSPTAGTLSLPPPSKELRPAGRGEADGQASRPVPTRSQPGSEVGTRGMRRKHTEIPPVPTVPTFSLNEGMGGGFKGGGEIWRGLKGVGGASGVGGDRTRGPRQGPPPLAVVEVLPLRVWLLTAYPAPWSLTCEAIPGRWSPGWATWVITNSREAYAQARASRVPVFVAGELKAMAVAAHHDRVGQRDLARWLERKRRDPGWRLGLRVALGDYRAEATRVPTELGEVLSAVGAELLRAEVHPPASGSEPGEQSEQGGSEP